MTTQSPETPKNLRIKGIFLTKDGGKTWVCSRIHYVANMDGSFVEGVYLQGMRLRRMDDDGGTPCQK